MRISRNTLESLIKEELHEVFSRLKDYPAAEMAAITSAIWSRAEAAGVEVVPGQRQLIVREIENVLADEGYRLKEQYNLGEELVFHISRTSAPNLYVILRDIEKGRPGSIDEIVEAFNE